MDDRSISLIGLIYSALLITSSTCLADAEDASLNTTIKQGEYVFYTTGGCSCHAPSADEPNDLSGGRPLETPFGTFFSTNITPDKKYGIGSWSRKDFIKAMNEGEGPDGSHFFPTFPYTSFTKITETELGALYEYLKTWKPIAKKNKEHDIPFPFNVRLSVWGWKLLFFEKGIDTSPLTDNAQINRGKYLVHGPAHCAECHTPRNIFGAMKSNRLFAGSKDGPEGESSPSILSNEDGIGDWSVKDIVYYLKTGMTPDGDFSGGLMAEVIDNGYQYLTDEDVEAIALYLKTQQ